MKAINNLKNISWALNKTITSSEAAIYNINNLPPSLQAKMSNLTMMTNDIISYAHQINEVSIFLTLLCKHLSICFNYLLSVLSIHEMLL